jgi:N-acetyl-gamma-glutamylphosphate reductase
MGFASYQLAQNNKVALETFEKYHQQTKKQETTPPFPTSQAKKQKQKTNDNLSAVEKEASEKFIREMYGDDEEVIDAEHDPNIEVSEEFDED